MAIPQVIGSQFFKIAGAALSEVAWERTSAVAHAFEATFYASLQGGVIQSGRLVRWLRDTSVGYVDEIQILFNLANVGFIALSTKKLFDAVQERYDYSIVKNRYANWTLKSAGIATAIAGIVFLGLKLVNRLSPELAKPETVVKKERVELPYVRGVRFPNGTIGEERLTREVSHKVDVAEDRSTQQNIAKVLHTTQLVLNVALACFVKNRFWLVVSLSMSSYSLWKNLQLKWITFTRDFNNEQANNDMTHIKPTYHMLALPPKAEAKKETCPICMDEEALEKIAFCTNHVFCKSCLGSIAHQKSAEFATAESFIKSTTKHFTNHVHTSTTYSYSAAIDQSKLPHCSFCHDFPLQNTISFEITDRAHGRFDASVTIKRPSVDRQYLFENLYAIYNTAQAGLAFLQTYPELAATIYKIQGLMLVTDVVGYTLTTYYLSKGVFNKINAKFNPQNSTRFKVATVAAMILAGTLTGAVSWYAMLQINTYLKSAMVLNDIMKQIGLSADVLKTLNVSFNAPLLHQAMQALLINRIIASAALVFFSNQPKTNLLSVTTQLGSLMGLSSLKWIQVVQTLEAPLTKIVATGGQLIDHLRVGDVKRVTATYHFLANPSCLANIQSTLKSIADFTSNFFNKSSWKRYWLITRTNGVETGRDLYYQIALQKSAIKAFGSASAPYLMFTSTSVVDALYGSASVITRSS